MTPAELDDSSNQVVYRKVRPTGDPTSYYPKRSRTTEVLRAGSTVGPARARPLGARWHGGTRALPVDITFEQDVPVTMRDGSAIYVDVFRPPGAEDVPAIISWSPYGKQGGYWNYAGWNLGHVPRLEWVSGLQKFEGPDPAEWVAQGYAVINPDPPGAFGSEGLISTWGRAEGRHVYDVIEWTSALDWCNGRVGMAGNSWLAISQWFAAAEHPPHLAAIAPWNGFYDIYDFTQPGGVPAPVFGELLTDFQWGTKMEWLPKMMKKFPLKNAYWDDHDADLESITVPAYVAHALPLGVHKWTPEAFRRLGSAEKWLRLNNTHEWFDQYTPEYVEDLRRFFDRYLKNIDNGWETTPRVRLCVTDPAMDPAKSANSQYRDSKGYMPATVVDRPETEWPLARTEYRKLHLGSSTLSLDANGAEKNTRYKARFGKAEFTYTFTETTEVIGYTSLNLWFEADGSNDADLFFDLCKLNASGKRVGLFESGTIRVSHRALDPERSTAFLPVQSHRSEQLLASGEIVEIQIGIAPASMVFHRGEQLRLRITPNALHWRRDPSGETMGGVPATVLSPRARRNKGVHVIHHGGKYDSNLTLPVIPPSAE